MDEAAVAFLILVTDVQTAALEFRKIRVGRHFTIGAEARVPRFDVVFLEAGGAHVADADVDDAIRDAEGLQQILFVREAFLMALRGVFRTAEDDLLDLVELMDAEDAAGLLAVAACLRAEARRVGGVAARQRLGFQRLVRMVADQCLFACTDQRKILALKRIGLITEERQIARAVQRALLREAGGHEQREAAGHQFLLRPEVHGLRQLRAFAHPVVEACGGDFRAASRVDDAQDLADGLMVAPLEGEFGLVADETDGDVVVVVLSFGHFVGQQVGHPAHLLFDLRLQLFHLRFLLAQRDLHGLHLFAGFRILLAFLAQGVAFRTQVFNFLDKSKIFFVHGGQCIHIDVATATLRIRLDHVQIFTQQLDVKHVSFPVWLEITLYEL